MIPFVRTVAGMADCRKILAEQGLVGSQNSNYG